MKIIASGQRVAIHDQQQLIVWDIQKCAPIIRQNEMIRCVEMNNDLLVIAASTALVIKQLVKDQTTSINTLLNNINNVCIMKDAICVAALDSETSSIAVLSLTGAETVTRKSKQVISCIGTAEDQLIVGGSAGVEIWSTKDWTLTQTVPSDAVLDLVCAGDLFYYALHQNRFIHSHSLTGGPQSHFSLDADPQNIALSKTYLLALLEDGTVSLFYQTKENKKKKHKHRTRTCDGSIEIIDNGKRCPILKAWFLDDEKVAVVYGNGLQPKFDVVSFLQDGKIQKSIQLERSLAITQPKADDVVLHTPKSIKYKDDDASIIGAADFSSAKKAVHKPNEDELLPIGSSMREKLESLLATPKSEIATDSPSKPSTIPKADSLQQMLTQALHTNDAALLDTCLNFTAHHVITSTVTRLPTRFVIPLLNAIVEVFQKSPARAATLAKWMKAVLVIHMAYLMTQPDLDSRLSTLYSIVDARTAVFDKLCKLQGRLDVIDTHVRLSAQREKETQERDQDLKEPLVVYHEDETLNHSESMDDDEVEEEIWEDMEEIADEIENLDENGSDSDEN